MPLMGENTSDPASAGTALGTGSGPDQLTDEETAVRFLAVGDMAPPQPVTGDPAPADITCLPFAEVTREALDRIRPDVVFSSLVGPGFDCMDLAERLAAAGFRGKYRAVAPTVPDPELVRREITDRFPALDFDLVILADHA